MMDACLQTKTKNLLHNEKPMKKSQLIFATTLALIGSAVVLHAQPIAVSVHFNGVDGDGIDNSQNSSLINIVMDPTGATVETAGAPGFAQTNWNNLDRWGDVTSGVVDYTGTDSGLHLQWDAPSAYSSGAYANLGTPDGKLMDGFDSTDWAGGPPAPWTAGAIYGGAFDQKPAEYVGGIQTWLAAKGQGSKSYSVVLYVQGWHGWYGTSEHWVQAVTGGNPSSWTMTVGGDVTPRVFCQDNGTFTGTYTQVPLSSTNYADKTGSGNYIVFNGLTNDAILIQNVEPVGDYQAGKLFGFQIVATPPVPLTTALQISPNPAYALSPVTLAEVASSSSTMTYQWQTDGGSGGGLTNIPGATASTAVVVPPDQGTTYTINYDCVVANSFGSVTTLVSTLTVNAASQPILTSDTSPLSGDPVPSNIYAFAGGTVTLAAAFDGTQPITNQWQVNTGSGFSNIGPATITNMNLVLANLQLSEDGSYQLAATNVEGNVSSDPATLTVLADPPAPTSSEIYAYDVLSKSPAAFWRLDEVVDPTSATYQAYDSSGNGLDAIYGAGVTTAAVGPQAPAIPGFETTNTAAGFTTSTANGAVVVPPLNLNGSNMTITAWIYPTANSPTFGGLLFNRNSATADAAGLGFGGNTDTNSNDSTYGQAELGYNWNNNSAAYNFHSGLFAPLNTWSFVVLTITPTSATLYLCYNNGTTTNVLKAINTVANSPETFNSGTTWLGGDPSGVSKIFMGSMDEVAVFNSALSDSDVLNLYFAAQGGGTAPIISQQPAFVTGSSSASTFAGQSVTLTAYGLGYPTPAYQWQRGTGGAFQNLVNDSHLSGANSSTVSIHTTSADAQNYQLVLTNIYGSATSSVATLAVTPIPLNGLWTVNFAIAGANDGAPTTPYRGPGVLGSGTFWNALGGGAVNTTSFCDDGVTTSGINFLATSYPGTWYEPNPQSPLTKLLDPYFNTPTSLQITNLPNGTYNLVVFGISGTYLDDSRGTEFTVNGVSQDNVFQQDYMFAPGDNSALFTNVQVTNGGLLIAETAIGLQSDGVTANTECDFNGAQIQAVSLDPVSVSATVSGSALTLNWANYGTLMSATNLAGPWGPVTGAVSPFVVSTTNAAAMFFSVKIH